MAGMHALGRVNDVIPNASGVAISLKNCSGAQVVVYNSTVASNQVITASTAFSGSYTQPAGFTPVSTKYSRTDGTSAWTKTAITASNTVSASATAATVFDILVSEMPDGYDYIKVTSAAPTTSSPTVILYDLTVQRKPENLAIPSA